MSCYEIRVSGPIGPVVASAFPEFDITVMPGGDVLTGTVAAADDLLDVLALLRDNGLIATCLDIDLLAR